MKVLSAVPPVIKMLADGTIEVPVGHTFDLSDAAEAHELIEARKSTGKVALVP